MSTSKKPLYKFISVLVTITFFISNISWAVPPEGGSYTPFDDNQQQSDYLSSEQLQEYADVKTSLIEKHNSEAPQPLSNEEEVIQYLYSLLAADVTANLSQLENNYDASVSGRQSVQAEYIELQNLLTSYYQEAQNARANIQNVDNQIAIYNSRISAIEEEKERVQGLISDIDSEIGTKEASMPSLIDTVGILQSDLTDLLVSLNGKETELGTAQNLLVAARNEYDDALAMVHAELGDDFDVHSPDIEKVYDGEGNLTEVILPAEYQILPDIDQIELHVLDALLRYDDLEAAQNVVDQKETERDQASTLYYDKQSELLSTCERVKLIEFDISVLNEIKDTRTAQYDDLVSASVGINNSITGLQDLRNDLEAQLLLSQEQIETEVPGIIDAINETGEILQSAIGREEEAKSLYEEALEAIKSSVDELIVSDEEVRSGILSALIGREEGETEQEYLQRIENMTDQEIDEYMFYAQDRLVLINGKIVDSEEVNRVIIRDILRENFKKIFGKEPGDNLLNVMRDIIFRVKIPAIRVFEVISRIENNKIEATEKDEKLEDEKDEKDAARSEIDQLLEAAIIEDMISDILGEENEDLLNRIVDRLTAQGLGSTLLNDTIGYLSSIPTGLVSCGAIALSGLFNSIGIDLSVAGITEEAVLTDVVAGSMKTGESGLNLSLFALKETAANHGLELYGQKIDPENIVNIEGPFVAHVNDNHYVLVKNIKEDRVAFFDPDPYRDNTSSLQEFSESFTGYALTLADIEGATSLEDSEMKGVFGAGWWSKAKSYAKKTYSKAKSTVKKVVSKVSSAVKSAAKKVSSAAKSVASKVSSAAKSVAKKVSSAAKSVASKVSSAAKSVSNKAKSTYNKAKSKVSETYNAAKDKVTEKYNEVKAEVTNWVSEKKETVDSMIESGKEKVSAMWTTAKEKYAKAKETYENYKKEQAEKAKEKSNQEGEKSFIDSLSDFLTIIPGVSAATDIEPATAEDPSLSGDDALATQAYGVQDPQVCSIDNPEYMSYLDAFNNGVEGNDLSSNNVKTVVIINEDNTATIYTIQLPPEEVEDDSEHEVVYATQGNTNVTGKDQVTVLDLRDQTVSVVSFETQEDSSFSPFIPVEGTSKGLSMAQLNLPSYITEQDLLNALPESIDQIHLPGGQIPTEGVTIDIGGGIISRNKDAINIDARAIADGDNAFIRTAGATGSHLEIPEVLEYLNSRGVKADEIFLENVPWDNVQTPRILDASGELLKSGSGTMQIVPPPTVDGDRLVAQFADSIDGTFSGPVRTNLIPVETDLPLGKTGSYKYAEIYTVTNKQSNFLLDAIDDFKGMSRLGKGIVIADIAISTYDIGSGIYEDATEGFDCHSTEAVGRVAAGSYGAFKCAALASPAGPLASFVAGAACGIVGGWLGGEIGRSPCDTPEIYIPNQGTMMINDPMDLSPYFSENQIKNNYLDIPLDPDVAGERKSIPGETVTYTDMGPDFLPGFTSYTYSTWSGAEGSKEPQVTAADVLKAIDAANNSSGSTAIPETIFYQPPQIPFPSVSNISLNDNISEVTSENATVDIGADSNEAKSSKVVNFMKKMAVTTLGPVYTAAKIVQGVCNWATEYPERYSKRYLESRELGSSEGIANLEAFAYAAGGHIIEEASRNAQERYKTRRDVQIDAGRPPLGAKIFAGFQTVGDFTGWTKAASAINGRDSVTYQPISGKERVQLGIEGAVESAFSVFALAKAGQVAKGVWQNKGNLFKMGKKGQFYGGKPKAPPKVTRKVDVNIGGKKTKAIIVSKDVNHPFQPHVHFTNKGQSVKINFKSMPELKGKLKDAGFGKLLKDGNFLSQAEEVLLKSGYIS